MGLCTVHIDAYRGQKRVLDPPELELQVVESYTMGTLGTEFESSMRAASAHTPEPSLQPQKTFSPMLHSKVGLSVVTHIRICPQQSGGRGRSIANSTIAWAAQ